VRSKLPRVRCSTVIVTSDFLVHATGMSALVINVVAMAKHL
jgi:hypothetical protein